MTDERRRFTAAWAAASALSFAVYFWMVTAATGNPFRFQKLNANFYDAQARAILHGHLAVPARELNIEGFRHGGKTYTYFPPFPALLRLPIIAVTDSLDGRLTAVSMLVAFVVALVAAGVLTWRVRGLVRGSVPMGRIETVLVALFALLIGIGSQVFFTASRPWVYNESAAWGMALAVAAFDQIVAFLDGPSPRRLVRASAFAGASVLSRAPTGAGALCALGLVFLVAAVGVWWPATRPRLRWTGVPDLLFEHRRWLGGLAAAAAVPVAIYVAINFAKFGTLFSVPYDAQVQSLTDPHRQRVLAANGGSLFALKAIPTQALQYFRPDAIHIGATFPWIGTRSARPTVIGDLLFDQRDYTVSVTAGMPLLVALAATGVVSLCRQRAVASLRIATIAAACVLPVSLSFLYIAQRYASDLFPLLLMLAVVGFAATATWLERRRVPWRRTVTVAAAALVAIGCWTGIATALEYQRNLAPVVTTDIRRQYVDWQWRVAERLGFGAPEVRRGTQLPEPGTRNSLFVIGPCDALYVSDGDGWRPVERANTGGHFRVALDEDAVRVGSPVTLVRSGSGADRWTIVLERIDAGHAFVREEHDGQRSDSFRVDDGTATYELVLDPRLHLLTVQRGDREVWSTTYDGPDGAFAPGTAVRNLEVPTSVCRHALPHARG